MNSFKKEMVSHIESHPNDFEKLIELAISNKQPYSWRAAWLLWSCMENNDSRIQKHIEEIINILDKLKDGHQRNLINILMKMKIKDEHEGLLFDTCIKIWTRIDKQSSVRFKSFEFIVQFTKKYPDLFNEVILLTQDKYLETLSEGIKKSTDKIIKNLNQQGT